ncbi:MAG: CBS domain-containing protein [Algibacter sp.]
MIRKRPISTIMTHQVIFLNREDSLKKASELFKQNHIRHIPVVSGNILLGILSYSDLIRIDFDDSLNQKSEAVKMGLSDLLTIDEVMTENIMSINASNTIKEVAKIFIEKKFHALPVVDNNQLIGIVTTTDLINYMLKPF